MGERDMGLTATKDCPGFRPTVADMQFPRHVCVYCEHSLVNTDDGEPSCDGDWEAFEKEKG